MILAIKPFSFEFNRPNVHTNVLADVQAQNDHPDLTDNELLVYQKIKNNCKIQKSELVAAINRGEKTVQRILVSLDRKGYVKRIGNNQYGYWEVLK